MQPKMCVKCKKNVAVVFITKIENGNTLNEGYCLKCARSLGIPQIDQVVKQMGISEDDLDMISDEMSTMFGQNDTEAEDDGSESRTATFPLLNQLFGNGSFPMPGHPKKQEQQKEEPEKRKQGKKHKFLDSYCMDLTGRARAGKLDRVIGRDVETERVIQILNRRQKNNPCLVGEPGVGKTAIAEGLAQRIVAGDVPYKLRDKEVFLLDLTALVAGTQFRGQFESRMKSLISEIKECGNIILVVDEVHNLVGAGDAEGSMNAANILKPPLSRGDIQIIGATTYTEYRKYIEKDAALERRFQPVTVAEPTMEQAIQILQGIAKTYADYHSVVISPEIARQCVVLSERYITDRFLPDKAIDLLDEACSDVNLRCKALSRLAELRKERDDYELELRMFNEDTENQNFERLATIRSKLCQIAAQIEELEGFIAHKHAMWKMYKDALDGKNGYRILDFDENGVRPNKWFYSLYLEDDRHDRDSLIAALQKEKIQTRPVWALIHEQADYPGSQAYGLEKAEEYRKRIVNLPCSTNLTREDCQRVIDLLLSL